MSFAEQEKRGFAPIESTFSEIDDPEHCKTYATLLPYVDRMRIKAECVVVCDIHEDDVKAGLGGAIKRIDRLCRFLSIAYIEDTKQNFKRERFELMPYLYQVNRVYSLDASGNELEADPKLESGYVYLPNRPALDQWRHKDTQKFLEDMYNFHDETLERAIKYLYRSSIGHFVGDSPEKRALDHFKSIEIIVKSLAKKGKFKERLEKTALKIGLTEKEIETINELWKNRSNYSDVAHPSPYDQAERYPNQFPLPSNVQYTHAAHDSIAVNVYLKYFSYKRSLFTVDIMYNSGLKEDLLGEINPQWESNHLFFRTSEKNKNKLKQKVGEAFIREYGINKSDIVDIVVGQGKKKVTIFITGHI